MALETALLPIYRSLDNVALQGSTPAEKAAKDKAAAEKRKLSFQRAAASASEKAATIETAFQWALRMLKNHDERKE
jgi:hypothetical protein